MIGDLTGKTFGSLIVIKRVPKPKHITNRCVHYLCKCICGDTIVTNSSRLNNGISTNCGCKTKDKIAAKAKTHGHSSNGKETDEYRIWKSMNSRCYTKSNNKYCRYGGRGIKVCARWRSDFLSFYEDMGPRPSKDHSIDRVNNDGNYELGNCRWATRKEQQRNTSHNRKITFNGKSQLLVEWSEQTGIAFNTLSRRINQLNWTVKKALTTPVLKH